MPKYCELHYTYSPFGTADCLITAIHYDPVISQTCWNCVNPKPGACQEWCCRSSFGMTVTSVRLYLWFGWQILVEVLKCKLPLATIRVPSIESVNTYQALIWEKHPAMEGVWYCMDGMKLHLQHAGDITTKIVIPSSNHESKVAEWGESFPNCPGHSFCGQKVCCWFRLLTQEISLSCQIKLKGACCRFMNMCLSGSDFCHHGCTWLGFCLIPNWKAKWVCGVSQLHWNLQAWDHSVVVLSRTEMYATNAAEYAVLIACTYILFNI